MRREYFRRKFFAEGGPAEPARFHMPLRLPPCSPAVLPQKRVSKWPSLAWANKRLASISQSPWRVELFLPHFLGGIGRRDSGGSNDPHFRNCGDCISRTRLSIMCSSSSARG